MSVVKPFEHHGHYTGIHNALLDSIMPVVSPSAWTLLCLMIRQTKGWQREKQSMSYRQLMEGTGFKSQHTISNTVSELLERELIVATKSGDKFDPFQYAINGDLEIEWEQRDFGDATAKSAAETTPPSAESAVGTNAENAVEGDGLPSAESAGINRKEESYSSKEKKNIPTSPRKPNLYYELFKSVFEERKKRPYPQKKHDFVQLSKWQKAYEGWATIERWTQGINNYFASPVSMHTLADLAARFDAFYESPLDRFNKPVTTDSSTSKVTNNGRLHGAIADTRTLSDFGIRESSRII